MNGVTYSTGIPMILLFDTVKFTAWLIWLPKTFSAELYLDLLDRHRESTTASFSVNCEGEHYQSALHEYLHIRVLVYEDILVEIQPNLQTGSTYFVFCVYMQLFTKGPRERGHRHRTREVQRVRFSPSSFQNGWTKFNSWKDF